MNWSKSLWHQGAKGGWFFLCPHCRIERRISRPPTPGTLSHYLRVGIAAAFFTLLTWQWLAWKGMFSFLPLWIAFEMVYRARVRADLHCNSCGFDPLLYMVDVQKAREEIRGHWKKKFEEKGIPYPGDAPQESPAPTTETPAV